MTCKPKQRRKTVFPRPKGFSRWIAACLLLSFCLPQQVCLSCFVSSTILAHCDGESCDCVCSSDHSDHCTTDESDSYPLKDDSKCPHCASKVHISWASIDAPQDSTLLISWTSLPFDRNGSCVGTARSIVLRPPALCLQSFHTRI